MEVVCYSASVDWLSLAVLLGAELATLSLPSEYFLRLSIRAGKAFHSSLRDAGQSLAPSNFFLSILTGSVSPKSFPALVSFELEMSEIFRILFIFSLVFRKVRCRNLPASARGTCSELLT